MAGWEAFGWSALIAGFALVITGFVIGWRDGSLGYDHLIMLGLGIEIGAVALLRPTLEDRFDRHGRPCPECGVRPLEWHADVCSIGDWDGGQWA